VAEGGVPAAAFLAYNLPLNDLRLALGLELDL
jgi:hypothetical protein